ncbi:YfjI family protein [Mobilicoccus massiliensis]|uniref:YfjI family protein n=1 Tax=Mobilicoccus massiliensis TaxID=1522310 RepID=UPI00069403D9|nr:YfjI family protein [Mobilicoccus massiliensis]
MTTLMLDDPTPLMHAKPTATFPTSALPTFLAEMVDAVAEATQTDVAMTGTSALSVLAAMAGGQAEIEPRTGWREPLCLFTATIAEPGERKSAVQAMMTAPLLDAEEVLVSDGEIARQEATTTRDIAIRAAENARSTAGKASGAERDKALAEAISATMAAESIDVPPLPRLLADDVTPEAVAGLLAEQRGRLAIVSAEGGVFDTIAGRYSNVPNLDVFLKGHAGDTLKVDRRGRAPEFIRRPALSMGLMVQPDVIRAIGQNRTFRGRGLTARFLYARPVSRVGHRRADAAPVPATVLEAYNDRIREMAMDLHQWAGDPAVLTMSTEAREALVRLMEEIEPQLDPRTGSLGHMTDWGSKFVGAVTRIAGLLHLATHDAEDAIRVPVSGDTFDRATAIGRYYLDQARAVFREMGADEDTLNAVYLLDRTRGLGAEEVTERDLMRVAQKFRTKADMAPALNRLVDAGWLIPVEITREPGTRGRPPSPSYRVHPATWEA